MHSIPSVMQASGRIAVDEDARLHLAALRRELEEAVVALRFARPSEARTGAQQRLQAARDHVEELDRVLAATGREDTGDLEARVLGRLRSVLAGPAAAPDDTVDRLAELGERIARPGPPDARLLAAYRETTALYARDFRIVPPHRLLPLLRAHVDRAAAHLDLPLRPSLRAELGAVVAETAALTGWTLHVGGRRGEAHAHFALARAAARDADQPALHALALGSMASLYSTIVRGTAERSRIALRLLEQAISLVPDGMPAMGEAWLHGRLAEEHAALGDAEGFASELERARALLRDPRSPGAGVFGPEGVLAFWAPSAPGPDLSEGFGMGVLGDPRGIERLLPLLAITPQPVTRATILGDLATAYLRRGEPEQALGTTIVLVETAIAGHVPGRLDRARGLRTQLPPDTHGLADLDDRLALAR